MKRTYYFDTSIWLDFFEERNEYGFPKSTWVRELLRIILLKGEKVCVSDYIIFELLNAGYTAYELDVLFGMLKHIIIFIQANKKQIGKAKDLTAKRNIPKGDAIHALIARDTNCLLITFDRHFKKLTDIIDYYSPKDFI